MSYAGDITPEEAWKLLADDPHAVLVDCRTDAEWRFVGVPDTSSLQRDVVYIEWNRSDGGHNDGFVDDLVAAGVTPGERSVVFLCRSGNRSIGAAEAATAAGIAPSYNVLDGFEGNLDSQGHRGFDGLEGHRTALEAIMSTPDQPVPSVRIPKPLPDGVGQATVGVRGGLLRSNFEETSEALYLTSGYVYETAGDAEKAFTGEIDRYVYSRYGNPTISMFEERLRLIEGAPAAFATATGMAAVFTGLGALLGAGDRLVAARSLFGSCFVVCSEILPRWGVEVVFVDGEDLSQWEEALSVPTQAVFFETPSNPMQSLVDIAAVSELAHAAGAKVVLDNVFATPLLQQGLPLGADVVIYSGTKHIDGQGRVLGGAILGDEEFIDGPVQKLMRHTGPAISAFNAWVMLKGLETLSVRVNHSNASAHRVAEFLEAHPGVSWVKYPFLESHPQYELAKRQMRGGGTVVTFELAGAGGAGNGAAGTKSRAFEVLDKLQIIDISNNLGDAKSLITHPATTTHRAMGPEGRAAIGLGDAVVRVSIGLEDTDDLIADLDRALN